MTKTIALSFATFLLLIFTSCNGVPQPTPEEVNSLRAKLESTDPPGFVPAEKERVEQWNAVVRFYQSRDFRPVWIVKGHPQPRVNVLKQVLEQAPQHGLETNRYGIASTGEDPMEYELRLTWAFFQFGFDVADQDRPVEQVLAEAAQASDANTLVSVVDNLQPKNNEYAGLQGALQRYRQLPGNAEWINLPLEAKLRMVGDWNEQETASLPEAVKRFEARHGLPVDGAIDPQFTDAINVSPKERIRQISTNMERLRSLPSNPGERYVRVNIPDYRLTVFEGGREALTMAVVVGTTQTPTPTLSEKMTQVIFSPYWNIPESILTKETLPKVFKDENYLANQNIEVVRVTNGKREIVDPSEIDWSEPTSKSGYHFRQRPGPSNSLGLVKFIFPNRHNVYLHDTPADNLFSRSERDFSHGCVRVEQPLELAAFILRDHPQWPREKIESAMHSGDETAVELREALPVHIIYLTAWGGPDGRVHFRKDVYGLDRIKST